MPHPKVKISDDSGNTVGVDTSSNALNVKLVESIDNIDIGDVSLLLGGTAADHGAGAVGDPNNTLRVTLASDDPAVVKLGTIDTDTNNIATSVGSVAGAIGTHDNGAGSYGMHIMGQSRILDGNALPLVSHEGDSTKIACSMYGVQFANLVTEVGSDSAVVTDDVIQPATPGMVNVGGEYRSSNTTYSNGDAAIMQSDINGALKTTHNVTGGGDGVTTDDTSGQVLGGDVACKKIDIQAQTDNTGVIAVGFTGVDATVATGTGIILYAGDVYSLEINNLNLIYIESSESGEGVRYTYFT